MDPFGWLAILAVQHNGLVFARMTTWGGWQFAILPRKWEWIN